jgi:branched-subunit amino acid ABC-type transport system permease component
VDFLFVQFLNGLASASSLFLVASGLSIIFGVTRIVNFAHGAFYMIGAYLAFTLTQQLSGPFGFYGAMIIAALGVALLGALVEMTLLRRIYEAPELFQLLATFGLTLMVEDLVVMIWGPEDLLGPRAPGLEGAVSIFGQRFPAYDFLLIASARWCWACCGCCSTRRAGACSCAPRPRTAPWCRRSGSTRPGCSPACSRSASSWPASAARSRSRARRCITRWT